jgi:hydrogenase maturation protease
MKNGYTQHSYSFLDLLKLFHPHIQGVICAIEIHKVEFGYGLSPRLQEKVKDISQEILSKIYSAIGVKK